MEHCITSTDTDTDTDTVTNTDTVTHFPFPFLFLFPFDYHGINLFPLPGTAESSLLLDGVDVLRLGLHTLRKHISIIPQTPWLFSGTLRQNLDPFEEYVETLFT